MENLLLAQLREALPQDMRVPSELEALYAWIEANGFYDDVGGRRRGYLYPQDRLQQSWSDDEREGGTDIIFFTDEPKNRDEKLRYWFYGEDRELAAEIKQRLCVFAGSGSEGSMCALWLDDAGEARPRTWAPARARRWPAFWLAAGLNFCDCLRSDTTRSAGTRILALRQTARRTTLSCIQT